MSSTNSMSAEGASTVTIASRFSGPPTSGNGGYSAGMLAERLEGAVEVTLRQPPPLDTPLTVTRDESGEQLRLRDGERDVLVAIHKPLELELPTPPSWELAEEMSSRYAGFEQHVFPTCFTCGPARAEGDGLRIFAGRRRDDENVAAPFAPSASTAIGELVRTPIAWAALDCPGYFAVTEPGEKAVLGRMHAEFLEPLRVGERYVVVGWPLGRDGRKLRAGTAVFRAGDGACLGRALQTWITLD